jgi:hypothetical protein
METIGAFKVAGDAMGLMMYLTTLLIISMATYRLVEFWHIKNTRSIFKTHH